MSDIFQEVDEDVRRDKAADLWGKYQTPIFVIAFLIVATTGAWSYYQNKHREAAEAANARFEAAAALANEGKTAEAAAAFDALAKDASVDPILQDHATLQAASLRLDKADYAEMEQRLKPLAESSSAWRFSARELLGLSAYRLKNMREAETQFNALIGDEATPQNLRERAEMMIALIVGAPQTLSTTAQ